MKAIFGAARQLADAVLYEGYILYPYRASARKNRMRWQFGVVAPKGWCEAGGGESPWLQTECLIEPGAHPNLVATVRFLQLQQRTVEQALDPWGERFRPTEALEVDGSLWTAWDEGIERTIDVACELEAGAERAVRFSLRGTREVERISNPSGQLVGRVLRERWPIQGEVRLSVQQVEAVHPLMRVRIRVDNASPWPARGAGRGEALRSSLIGTHVLIAVEGGAFVSMTDPPAWARPAAEACANVRSWPVLAGPTGDRSIVLAAPIILQDHPTIAPESPADFYDSTEIDELLALRTMTLTDEEKREARATDPRAAEIIDRVDSMAPKTMAKLHGAVRSMRPLASGTGAPTWWSPEADAAVAPERDTVEVDGVTVGRGSLVRLRPGRRADAQDMFLAGRVARVEGVFLDVEDRCYVAVSVLDDPGADLHVAHGRFLYFDPDEIEPLPGPA